MSALLFVRTGGSRWETEELTGAALLGERAEDLTCFLSSVSTAGYLACADSSALDFQVLPGLLCLAS